MGFGFGFLMNIYFSTSEYFRTGAVADKLLFLAAMNTVGGLFFGGIMWFFLGSKKG